MLHKILVQFPELAFLLHWNAKPAPPLLNKGPARVAAFFTKELCLFQRRGRR